MEIRNGIFWLGDCLELMRDVPSGSVDMVLCDLPYGTTACAWDTIIPLDRLWVEYWRVAKPSAAIVLTASQPFTTTVVASQLDRFKYEWIWRKNAGSNFAQMKYAPMKEHESCLVFAKGGFTYNPVMQPRAEAGKRMIRGGVKSKPSTGSDVYGGANKGYDNSGQDPDLRYPSSVQLFNRERGRHPTQKPVALFEYLVRTYTNPGEVVLDNCMGSGTTAIACERSGRRWVGIEQDPGYYWNAVARLCEGDE